MATTKKAAPAKKPVKAAKPETKPKAKTWPKGKHPGGRPTKYTEELAEEICLAIATTDKGLKYLCRENPSFPDPDTVRRWTVLHKKFYAMYMQAKASQQLWMGERAQEIADDGSNDTYVDDDGKPRVDHDHISRSRLRVDTIKWHAAKLAPRVFGEKVDVNHGVEADSPLAALLAQVQGTPFKPREQ